MAWIPDVNPNELIESSWGNDIRDRTVTPFTNAAQRTTAIPTPDAGMVTYLTATDALEYWNGTSWRNVGPGQLAYKILGANQIGITTMTDITGQAATVTLPAGRRIEVATSATFYKAGADTTSEVALRISDGAGVQQLERVHTIGAPGQGSIHVFVRLNPPAGTVTYKAQAATGAGYVNITAGARFWIDDIGPATMPT